MIVARAVPAVILVAVILPATASCGGGGATSSTKVAPSTSAPAGPTSTLMGGEAAAGEPGDVWRGIESQVGSFGEVRATRVEQSGAYTVVYVTTAFGTQTLDVKVVFDAAGRGTSYERAAYVVADAFTEQEVTVGTGTWALPGTRVARY